MANLALVLLLLWVIIYGVYHLSKPHKAQALLPTSRLTTLRPRRDHFWSSRTTQVVLNKLHLRVQTSAWNSAHDALSKALLARRRMRLRTGLVQFYNAGCVMGVLGTAISLGFMMWNCGTALLPLVHNLLQTPSVSAPTLLLNRGLEVVKESAGYTAVIRPVIPGITVPLDHLPFILSAVFVAQIIHELGHAVSAALEAVPITSAGASLTVVMPAAFVTFPATSLEALKPLARSRIIGAGPFHNLAFWCFLILIGHTGAGGLFARTIYQEVSTLGRVVMDIDDDSALREHLPLGSLITKLDDTSLGSETDRWTSYLTSPYARLEDAPGWCTDAARYLGNPQSCCGPHALPSSLSCFTSSDADKRCLDPIPILTGSGERRCGSDIDCSDGSRCIRPDTSAQILRLTVRVDANDEVILWSGPLVEVHEQVQVGKYLPRFRILPLWIYTSAGLFWDYLRMATLSLYLFNLLPLPFLDGSQFVQAMLEMVFEEGTTFDEYDIEALEAASTTTQRPIRRSRARWKERLRRAISMTTSCLFVFSTILALMNAR
ncbi:hypothetical protein B0H10DRAFT_1848470 [Mycena sp. CBHHK59/15]|nr:hypothetical protein B0H10DRAFT_1848470 [Mycena sp. CBHHK59/15]